MFGKIDLFLLFCPRRACAAPEGGKTARRNQFCQTNVLAEFLKSLSLGCLKASEFYGQNAFFGYDESRIYLVKLSQKLRPADGWMDAPTHGQAQIQKVTISCMTPPQPTLNLTHQGLRWAGDLNFRTTGFALDNL